MRNEQREDLDVFEVAPKAALERLLAVAGKGRALARRHKVYLDVVTGIAEVPYDYDDRLIPTFPDVFANLFLKVMDPYDIVLTKLRRASDRDFQDVRYLARAVNLDIGILEERYQAELEPFLIGDKREPRYTLDVWLEAIREDRESARQQAV